MMLLTNVIQVKIATYQTTRVFRDNLNGYSNIHIYIYICICIFILQIN